MYGRRCARPLVEAGGVRPTTLYPHRADVAGENRREFEKLATKRVEYNCIDGGSSKRAERLVGRLDKDCQAARTLQLKVGTQVRGGGQSDRTIKVTKQYIPESV
eukprot:3734795-Pyramimonas_sp.AAC.1